LDDFDGRAEASEGIDFEYLHRLDGLDAAVSVFGEKGFENGASLLAILAKDVALLHVVGAFLAGERWLVVGDVTDEIEGIVVAPDLIGQFIEEESLGGQFFDEGSFRLSVISSG
jgi:hypothetical protein